MDDIQKNATPATLSKGVRRPCVTTLLGAKRPFPAGPLPFCPRRRIPAKVRNTNFGLEGQRARSTADSGTVGSVAGEKVLDEAWFESAVSDGTLDLAVGRSRLTPMRWLLLSAVLLAAFARGAETPSPAMREKLRARIVETLPPASTTTAGETRVPDAGVLVLEPIVVTESRGVRELEKTLAEDRQRQEAQRFTPLKGGTIYRSERVELGAWWEPASGWTFLKLKW